MFSFLNKIFFGNPEKPNQEFEKKLLLKSSNKEVSYDYLGYDCAAGTYSELDPKFIVQFFDVSPISYPNELNSCLGQNVKTLTYIKFLSYTAVYFITLLFVLKSNEEEMNEFFSGVAAGFGDVIGKSESDVQVKQVIKEAKFICKALVEDSNSGRFEQKDSNVYKASGYQTAQLLVQVILRELKNRCPHLPSFEEESESLNLTYLELSIDREIDFIVDILPIEIKRR